METGIKIGHDQQSVTDVGNLIRYIVDAPTGERVKMAALEAMKETLTITNISVSNCHLGNETHHHFSDDDIEQGDDQ
jgi:hypothetical protein